MVVRSGAGPARAVGSFAWAAECGVVEGCMRGAGFGGTVEDDKKSGSER